MRPTGRKESDTNERERRGQAATPERIDLAAEFAQSGVAPVLQQLDDELIGLAPVKQRIREIAALLLVDRVRAKFGLTSQAPTLHMSFTGNPGTGKTTVAARMAEILHKLGYVRRGHLVAVTRDDLVGQYIGHTAPKTKEVLKKAMGGVLFIDEAYYLYRQENERDYGQESIEILLQVMENNRDDLVVILAGYADKMDRFFHSNPGFRSRVAHHIDFPDYARLRSHVHRREDACFPQLHAEPGSETRARPIYFVASNAAALRQRTFDPQRAGPRPPASGQSPVCGRRPGTDSRRAHHHRGGRHPPEQGFPTTGNKRIAHDAMSWSRHREERSDVAIQGNAGRPTSPAQPPTGIMISLRRMNQSVHGGSYWAMTGGPIGLRPLRARNASSSAVLAATELSPAKFGEPNDGEAGRTRLPQADRLIVGFRQLFE